MKAKQSGVNPIHSIDQLITTASLITSNCQLTLCMPVKIYISLKSFFFVRDWAGSASGSVSWRGAIWVSRMN